MAQFVAEALRENLDRLIFEERQQVIEHFKKLGIDRVDSGVDDCGRWLRWA